MPSHRLWLIGLLLPIFGHAAEHVTLTVEDLTPKFLSFYQTAEAEHANEKRRWELWNKMYHFAAVPPTPEGDRMARKMLDDSWPKYASVLPRIRQGAGGIKPDPHQVLSSVTALLQPDKPIHVMLLVFVGGFDDNAFTAPGKAGTATVSVPVEGNGLGLTMTHEFTHAVEAEEAGLSLGWQRSIAHTIFTEGLAMRVTQALHSGLPDKDYTGEFTPNWLARAESKRQAILADIAPHLSESDSDAVMRYTMGEGGAGIDREGYYAGWLVIDDLRRQGWTFPKLARVKDAEMTELVRESLGRMMQPQTHR